MLLPSYFEGLPNVVCEAMACGKPALVSNVSDNSRLVADGDNGFLFDPSSPGDLADTIHKFVMLSAEEKQKMGGRGRVRAEELFAPDIIVNQYFNIFGCS